MKRVIVVLFVSALIISCSKDDSEDNINTSLAGKWTLTNVSCFCFFGDNPDFSGHKITFEKNNLNVENTGQFEFLTDANGPYTITSNIITLNNDRQYTYVVKTNILELTYIDNPQIADDEVFMTYKRG